MSPSSTPQNNPEPIYTAPSRVSAAPPMTGSPNVSEREYIYFLPHPLPPEAPVPYTPGLPSTNPLNLTPHTSEPTSTLVLTSPARTFVDLRYLRPASSSESPLSNPGPLNRLDWGFAGTSHSAPADAPPHKSYGAFARAKWTHWVDSRVKVGDAIPADEGDMYDLGEGLFLEVGHAFHPHLGREAGHEELWRDVDARSTSAGGSKVCVVLRCADEVRGVRGVIVRVGQYAQGILGAGEELTTERWEARPEEGGGGEGAERWERTARTGDALLPCSVTFKPETVQLGGRIRYGALEWVVEETWEWQ
ncbi:hypothetical protein E8E13_001206 [Curvularia kusanoi]|uniref:Protein HRI1 n=1 Tax=Curvularia kusanoi TaxID=90978 RepID=A0A9P4T8P3_CURKU|nr:hypothetical protein E8E13_001206 [Curvularia kusanoi]